MQQQVESTKYVCQLCLSKKHAYCYSDEDVAWYVDIELQMLNRSLKYLVLGGITEQG